MTLPHSSRRLLLASHAAASSLFLFLCILPGAQLAAQETKPTLLTAQEVTTLREESEQALKTRRAALENAVESTVGASWLAEEVRFIERLLLLLSEQDDALKDRDDLLLRHQEIEQSRPLHEQVGVDHPPPFALGEFDVVLERLTLEQQRRESLESAIETEETALKATRERLQEAEKKKRALQEDLQGADVSDASRLRHQSTLAAWQEQLARQRFRLLELQLDNDRIELDGVTTRFQLLEEAVAWMKPQVQPSADELQQRLTAFKEQEQKLDDEIQNARLDLQEAESHWQQVQQRVAAAPEAGRSLQAEAKARRAELTLARRHAEMQDDQLELIPLHRDAWELRFRLLRGEIRGKDALDQARKRLKNIELELQRAKQQAQGFLDQAQIEAAETSTLLAGPLEEQNDRWYRQRFDAVNTLVSHTQNALAKLEKAKFDTYRALQLVEDQRLQVNWDERLHSAWAAFIGLWSWELFVVQGNPITLGKIILALLLVLLGHFASRRISSFIGRRVLSRFELDEGVSATLQTLTSYGLFLVFVFWALHLVNIPLTVFTFLGGALAIGVGFGSQNIVNNFMSGLILMIERPIKVGDLINFSGNAGRVEDIGPRSTRLRLGNNTDIIVPNSALLENSVFNWTHSNNLLRSSIDVGVAYGSDLEAVHKAIEASLQEASRVLDQPAPEILFMNFGDSSLDFRAFFWTRIGAPMDLDRSASEVRMLVDKHFRQAGIEIPFPQRDLHFPRQDAPFGQGDLRLGPPREPADATS